MGSVQVRIRTARKALPPSGARLTSRPRARMQPQGEGPVRCAGTEAPAFHPERRLRRLRSACPRASPPSRNHSGSPPESFHDCVPRSRCRPRLRSSNARSMPCTSLARARDTRPSCKARLPLPGCEAHAVTRGFNRTTAIASSTASTIDRWAGEPPGADECALKWRALRRRLGAWRPCEPSASMSSAGSMS
jgi:hypothetical protein